jgi:cytochrome c-type biogenesis protein CcmH/NrfG
VSFFRKEVVQFALDHETRRHMDEQRAWIEREPLDPRPWFHLAQLYRMENRQEEALGMLLEAVRLEAGFAQAHVALAEIYAVRKEYAAAWRHARLAERHNDRRAVDLLRRYGVPEQP